MVCSRPHKMGFNPRHPPRGSACLTSYCSSSGAAGLLVVCRTHAYLPQDVYRSPDACRAARTCPGWRGRQPAAQSAGCHFLLRRLSEFQGAHLHMRTPVPPHRAVMGNWRYPHFIGDDTEAHDVRAGRAPGENLGKGHCLLPKMPASLC